MYRRYRERRRSRRRYQDRSYNGTRWSFFTSAFRRPAAQIAFLLFVALVIFLILQSAGR